LNRCPRGEEAIVFQSKRRLFDDTRLQRDEIPALSKEARSRAGVDAFVVDIGSLRRELTDE